MAASKKEKAGEQSSIISLIAAVSTNYIIGKNNQLLWHLPEDMKFFKNTTWGLPVIMGRKTFEALSSKPLPGRYNIVVSHRTAELSKHQGVHASSSLAHAIKMAHETDCREVFIIGGGQIFEAAMEQADRIYLTRVHVELQGDAWFPPIRDEEWTLSSDIDFPRDAKHVYPYSFQLWLRN